MLTTLDNPYNPFTNYDEWLAFDEQQGYYTNGLIARLTDYSDELSDDEQEKTIEEAMNTIVSDNFYGAQYKKVYKK